MGTKTEFTPPEHLTAASADFWTRTQADYRIVDPAGQRLLTLACESLDAAESARAAIAKHGEVYTDRFGAPRPRPEVGIRRDSMAMFARLVRDLGLDPQPKGK